MQLSQFVIDRHNLKPKEFDDHWLYLLIFGKYLEF